mmetsp:Transcript_27181/g.44331  ORF Transcript_27181/g.44331 Transcript_27181/m.44331 type:complete len:128 (+) Transcript_27181:834-1217(+)
MEEYAVEVVEFGLEYDDDLVKFIKDAKSVVKYPAEVAAGGPGRSSEDNVNVDAEVANVSVKIMSEEESVVVVVVDEEDSNMFKISLSPSITLLDEDIDVGNPLAAFIISLYDGPHERSGTVTVLSGV